MAASANSIPPSAEPGEKAAEYVRIGLPFEAALERLATDFGTKPRAELEFLLRAERLRDGQSKNKQTTDTSTAEDSPSSSGEAIIREAVRSAPRGQFGHALLPAVEITAGRTLIPVDLARYCWIFSASRHPLHIVDVAGQHIEVGGPETPSLGVEHLRLLLALYLEGQRDGLQFVRHHGRPFLVIRTRVINLHRWLTPDSDYGGSSQERILRHLAELRDTPVVFDDPETGSRSNVPFVRSFWREGNSVIVVLHPRWSAPFEDESKRLLKPLLFSEFRDIPGDINKLVYLHLDWVLSNNRMAGLKFETILERAGAFQEDNDTADDLRRFPSQQAWRLRELWHLQGRKLSSGAQLELSIGNAKPLGKKLVATRADTNDAKPSDVAPVLSLDAYRRQRERWLTTPRAIRLQTRGYEVPPPIVQAAA